MTRGHPLGGALLGLAAMSVFAGYDISVKFLGASYSPFQIMFMTGIAAVPLVMAQMALDPQQGNFRPRNLRWTIIRVIVTLFNGLLGTYAFATLPLAQCYAIFFTMPLMISLLAVPMLGERISLGRGLAVLAGMIGVIVALQPGATPLNVAHLAAILAAATGALNYVIVRKMGGIERPAVLIIYPMLAQLAVVTAILPFVYIPMPIEHLALTGLMACFAIGGTYLVIAAYHRAPAIVVAPMQYSQIIWAALAGAFLFDESISAITWAGLGIIIASGLYILWGAKEGGTSAPVLQDRQIAP